MKRILLSILALIFAVTILNAEEAKTESPDEQKNEAVSEQKTTKSAHEYIADLSSDDEATVLIAADWIAKEEEKSAIPKLLTLLKEDKRVRVRLSAAVALGLIGEEDNMDSLTEALLNDRNADVRYSVVLAIHRIGVDSLKTIEALKKAKDMESDPFIKDYIEKMEAKFKEK